MQLHQRYLPIVHLNMLDVTCRESNLDADFAISGNTDLGFTISDAMYPDHAQHLPAKVMPLTPVAGHFEE